ncbi:glycosyltransferase family protein [Marinicellulosiphila megalodicopiae]|uniref:glycosyltransferase family protein n=1 Tax=Marinicellulosiphila megalodicopiae TaxID=2724896 RepID=UPI003BAFD063
MKVLVVGDWLAEIYEESFYQAFMEHGCKVSKFSWIQYFKYYQYANRYSVKKNVLLSLYYRFQNKFTFGPVILRINHDLIADVLCNKYDLIFIYRGTHIYPNTIKKLKKTGAIVFGYNNDDPFSPHYPKYFWRHFVRSINQYDHIFSYRNKNLNDYNKVGYENTSILRSYYLKNKNFLMSKKTVKKSLMSDVVFIGHFENDGRDQVILHILKSGVALKLYGTSWDKSPLINEIKKFTGEINPVYSNYNKVLNGAKIALVFLSKLNNDTYTRRVFEIPATKTLMLSEYTEDLASLYQPGEEILFFTDKNQCVNIIKDLLKKPELIKKISDQAYCRLMNDGHEVYDRVSEIIKEYKNEKSN